MPEAVKIYLVDDHKIFVKGVAALLETEPGLSVTGYTFDGRSAFDSLKENKPDVLITDIQMPGLSGIELTRLVKDEFPEIKVIGLSMFDKPEIINDLIAAGADGYLLKDLEKDELVKAINQIMNGNMYYSSSVANLLLQTKNNKDLLTKREKEIIALIAEEKTNVQIADKLFISEHTVESHRKNIFRKTKAKSIVGLVKYAYDNNLI
jgi:two-component system, NarL family, nitrate/nitrite response regulator NarL